MKTNQMTTPIKPCPIELCDRAYDETRTCPNRQPDALLTAIKDRLCMAITDHEKLLRIDELIRKAGI